MDTARWKQIDEVFEAALEREPHERPTFLNQACAGDEELRTQVESLLASEEQGRSFIETPAVELAAHSLSNQQTRSMTGRMVGPYKILQPLASGGMGHIYLAKNTKLDRLVALKVFPAYLAQDQDRMSRFEQEARAISALNHPAILTIYEVGHSESLHFIATEFIDGKTLRQTLIEGRSDPREAIDMGIQVAGALAAAHEAGVVHRDIKPENIMRRRDGYVKILDFGLAKMIHSQSLPVDPEVSTLADVQTNTGMVLGTTHYMSPEQARGLDIDGRSDIFSLGIVIYEMVAGRPPFGGETPSDVLASILLRDPPPLTHDEQAVPQELQRIVSKALCKDREVRYQTANELMGDLKDLRHQMENAAEPERPEGTAPRPQVTDKAELDRERLRSATGAIGKPRHRSDHVWLPTSKEPIRSRTIKRVNLGVAILIGVLFIAALVYFLYLAQR
ncbi:MAG: protein kinase [Acidobacteriia bacterium]|nr:protein kinase [Terriglobia bacterium]